MGYGRTTDWRRENARLRREYKRLRMERDVARAMQDLDWKDGRIHPKVGYPFMKANQDRFTVAAMCRVLDLSRSGYYDWLRREPSARARLDEELKARILEVWRESGRAFGVLRIQKALRAEYEGLGSSRVARLMRELGIKGKMGGPKGGKAR